ASGSACGGCCGATPSTRAASIPCGESRTMADLKNSPNPLNPQPEHETQWRLMLAFLLMGAVLFLTPYFYKSVTPASSPSKPAAATTEEAQPTATPEAAAEAAPTPSATLSRSAAAPVSAAAPETFIVDTKLYHVVLSNQGGVVRSWVLKKYKDS